MAQASVTNKLRSRIRFHPLLFDLGLTSATQFAVLAAGLLVVSLFSRRMGAVALGEYLLLRRVYSWFESGAFLGMGSALPRYVAHAVNKPAYEGIGYFLAASACAVGAAAVLDVILNAAKQPFGQWLFGGAQMTHLVLPLSLLLLGTALNNTVYGYYRGRLEMKYANALQFCNLGLVPMVAVLALSDRQSVALIMNAVGLVMLACAGLFSVPIFRGFDGRSTLEFRRRAAELLRYGVPRLPAALGHGAIFTLPPIIAAHYLPMAQVSYLLLGVSLLMLVSASTGPLSLILLSKVSMMLAENRLDEVRTRLAYLQDAVLDLYVFSCLQLAVFSDVLIRLWVGPAFLERVDVIRIVTLAIPFYLFFASQRGIIDAASVTPYSMYNIFVSAVVFLVLIVVAVLTMPVRLLLEAITVAMLISVIVLSWLTGRTVWKLYRLRMDWKHSAPALAINGILGATSLLLHRALDFGTGPGQLFLIELATALVFLAALRKIGRRWLPFFWNLARTRQMQAEAIIAPQQS